MDLTRTFTPEKFAQAVESWRWIGLEGLDAGLPGPVGKGTRFVAEPRSMGTRGEMTLEILDYDRPHRLHNVVRSSYMHVDGTLTFDEAGGRTRLRWDWEMRLVGVSRVLAPVLALVGPSWERRNWVGLQHYLESRAG